jgi:hypothetical protein
MRFSVLLFALLAACGSSVGFAPRPLPDLIATGSPLAALEVKELVLTPGESFAWSVQYQGIAIGRAELAVGEQEVRTKFETNALASAFASAKYELVTVIDRTAKRPLGASERIEADGQTTVVDASFDGKNYTLGDPPETRSIPDGNLHTLHSALGVIRGWADARARGGVLTVLVGGRPYRLVVSRPIEEDLHGSPTLKVAAKAAPLDGNGATISIAIWLTVTEAKAPVRIEVAIGDKQVTAEMIDE